MYEGGVNYWLNVGAKCSCCCLNRNERADDERCAFLPAFKQIQVVHRYDTIRYICGLLLHATKHWPIF